MILPCNFFVLGVENKREEVRQVYLEEKIKREIERTPGGSNVFFNNWPLVVIGWVREAKEVQGGSPSDDRHSHLFRSKNIREFDADVLAVLRKYNLKRCWLKRLFKIEQGRGNGDDFCQLTLPAYIALRKMGYNHCPDLIG